MPRIVWPYDDPYQFRTLVIGPYVLPGIAECMGIPAERDIDVKKVKGKSGATLEDNGANSPPIQFRLHQCRREHHDEWQRIFPLINPRREGATKEPFEILNPYTWEQDIHYVTIKKILPQPFDSKGKRIVVIDFVEWFDKAKEVKRGTGTPKPASNDVRAMTGDLLGMSTAPGQLVPETVPDPASPANMSSMIGELVGISR